MLPVYTVVSGKYGRAMFHAQVPVISSAFG